MLTVVRSAAVAIAAGFLALPAAAQDNKPNTLTPKEAADGWIMLFDGETTFGWKAEGEATVKDGVLTIGGAKPTSLTTTAEFGKSEYQFEFRVSGKAGEQIVVGFAPSKPGSLKYTVDKNGGGTAKGSGVVVDGSGRQPVRFEIPAGVQLHLVKLALRPENTVPLLNGKDLSGWKVFQGDPKRAASKFEVTKAGELRVTNGPGDLQTEGKYADFLLQLQCKTNGKSLNSGIFFRCIPDQYQNGYEAQIHNGYKEDRTKPVDFGTGAIYRRIAARKVVSDDNEWFTMTVLANGPHISTWVNGYQTVDWTDDRQPDPNPRKGLRTEAGHLSIQGHDPTTDILFRNIRIVELKK